MPIAAALELAVSFAWKHWRLILTGAVVGALSIMLTVRTIDRNQWRAAARAGDVALAKVKAAQPIAEAAQIAANHAPAAKSQTIAEKSNDDAKDYYEAGRRAGAAYADAHRLPAAKAACAPGRAYLPGTDHVAALDDGPGSAPVMVAVARTDFDTLTGNSLRLAKVHQDAEALIAAGVAVPSAPAP